MYSVLPGVVSFLFLAYAMYVVYAIGINRVTTAFIILCGTTFFWQATWAVLFQVNEPETANILIKIGWLLILFLPTSLYHFLTEISRKLDELRWVYTSYTLCALLALTLIFSDLLISGYYDYFFGYYPKAGILHPIHVLQTCLVVTRGLFITYKKFLVVQGEMKLKLRYCIISVLIYFFAAVDYLCNFGVEFYPPGVMFILISLGIIALSTTKYHILDDMRLLTMSMVHDMRTPLATAIMQAQALQENIPKLVEHYRSNPPNDTPEINQTTLEHLEDISNLIKTEIKSVNNSVDALLATTSYQHLNKNDFHSFSALECVEQSVSRATQGKYQKIPVSIENINDVHLFASQTFLTFIIINLINNAMDAIVKNGDGGISIQIGESSNTNYIRLRDTGMGIDPKILPHIFDEFFTTKARGANAGIGLAFCKHVMKKFQGDIRCDSVLGKYTCFELTFPKASAQ